MSENQQAAEVNSTDLQKREKSPEEKAKWAAYIREYRKRRKLAAGAVRDSGIETGADSGQSSPVAPPDAA